LNQVQFDSMAFQDQNEICEMKPAHFSQNLAEKFEMD
jgi:hypothetical protein